MIICYKLMVNRFIGIKTILKKASVMRMLKEKNEKLSLSNKRISNELIKIQNSQTNYKNNMITDPLTGLYNKSYFLKMIVHKTSWMNLFLIILAWL